jgi:hypothetical protein
MLLKKFPPQVRTICKAKHQLILILLDLFETLSCFVVTCPAHRPSRLSHVFQRLCSIHNEVNKRLEKPEVHSKFLLQPRVVHKSQFDCAHLDDTYDCGCGDKPVSSSKVDDLERDLSKDDLTGVKLIKGGR